MITPQDIQNKEFDRAVRGYKEEDVDLFLDELTLDYEAALKEIEIQKRHNEELSAKLEEYKSQEGAIINTLEAAKGLMNDISASAERRAEILLKNAELDAELKQRETQESIQRLKEEEASLSRRVASLRSRFKDFLEAELERFDGLSEDIFGKSAGGAQPSEKESSIGLSAWDKPYDENDDSKYNTITNFRSDK